MYWLRPSRMQRTMSPGVASWPNERAPSHPLGRPRADRGGGAPGAAAGPAACSLFRPQRSIPLSISSKAKHPGATTRTTSSPSDPMRCLMRIGSAHRGSSTSPFSFRRRGVAAGSPWIGGSGLRDRRIPGGARLTSPELHAYEQVALEPGCETAHRRRRVRVRDARAPVFGLVRTRQFARSWRDACHNTLRCGILLRTPEGFEELRSPMERSHSRDSDCTLDELRMCAGCGMHHGDPCPSCGKRAYHVDDCPEWRRFQELQDEGQDSHEVANNPMTTSR
jgi:hypothetical protein